MHHIREYSRHRLKGVERLRWLESSHTLPIAFRVYRTLENQEKRKLRAEAALLCPEEVKSRGHRGKYNKAGLYLITNHGVFAPQLRDLFSAGSVGARTGKRGHKYIVDAIRSIEPEMHAAACYLDERVFVEYWGYASLSERRIEEWLLLADQFATDWTPSKELFANR